MHCFQRIARWMSDSNLDLKRRGHSIGQLHSCVCRFACHFNGPQLRQSVKKVLGEFFQLKYTVRTSCKTVIIASA